MFIFFFEDAGGIYVQCAKRVMKKLKNSQLKTHLRKPRTPQKPMKYKNIEYKVIIHPLLGNLCGYVRIPDKHLLQKIEDYDDMNINCHGGLTFCKRVEEDEIESNTKFTKGYWIGWDYAHSGDFSPVLGAMLNKTEKARTELLETGKEKMWQPDDVEKECKNVINQLLSL